MALMVCAACSTAYAVGLAACPHCGSRDSYEEGTVVPKISVHGGATHAGDIPTPAPDVAEAPVSITRSNS